MVRIFINPQELSLAANQQRELGAEIEKLQRHLDAGLDGLELSAHDEELVASRFFDRVDVVRAQIGAFLVEMEALAHTMESAGEHAELAEALELGFSSIGRISLDDLVPTDFPAAPTALLDDLAPRFDGVKTGGPSLNAPLDPSVLRVETAEAWHAVANSGEAVKLNEALYRSGHYRSVENGSDEVFLSDDLSRYVL